ncbi:CD276 antigen-like protein [Labeo rohita]|uniref:CD276 antigen-like protein n=3 Tax=Labeo rohita TaxID=84645 RepID=A0A498MCP8_LABRO|nr:CD276 antigen-like protein [Labeo rohita]RXN18010.1 CD276 antigen-like protein [Labeo rohita]
MTFQLFRKSDVQAFTSTELKRSSMAIYKRILSGNLWRWCFFTLLSVFLMADEVSLQETVVGFIGDSVVLPCFSKKPPLTIQDITVLWRYKYDLNVYDIIKGKGSVEEQNQEYNNRAETFPEEYKTGNFSLKLNNLQHTDAGKYQCYIISKESEDWIVELRIEGV